MVQEARRKTAGKAALTPQGVIDTALALADAEGIDAVTIRRLAKQLGVTPMALYWHVRNKDELLDGIAARLFEAVDLTQNRAAPWQEQLRSLLGSMLDVLRAHPSAAMLLPTRTVSSEGGLQAAETMLEILHRAGFTPAEATQIARHAISGVANLVTNEPGAVTRNDSEQMANVRQEARIRLESLPPDRYPRLIEAARPLSEGIDPETYFAFGLDLLVAGIEAMAARKG